MKSLQQHPSRKPPAKRLPVSVVWWRPSRQPSYAPTIATWRCDTAGCRGTSPYVSQSPYSAVSQVMCDNCAESAEQRSLSR